MHQTTPDSVDSVYHVFSQIIRLHFLRFHELLEPYGLYPGQPPLLHALEHEGGLKQKELARRLRIQPSTMTVMLRRMETTGLIERRQDPNDQRVSRVYLTSQGKDACARVRTIVQTIDYDCFGNMQEGDREQLQRLLTIVRNNLLDKNGKDHDFDCKKGR